MQVTAGADWSCSTTGRRNYSLTLDLDDLRELKGEEFVSGLDFKQRRAALNKLCESLVVEYMASQGAISHDFAAKRLQAIKDA